MKIISQIVKTASCTVENKIISKINYGELILVSFNRNDDEKVVDKMIDKLLKMRIFPDENGNTNLNLEQIDGEILAISQFTLYASFKKTNRPSFIECLNHENALTLYSYFQKQLSKKYKKTKFGVFRKHMEISLINDGPFTVILDSEEI